MVAVLFVCLGNICRSPAAEGILRSLSQKDPQYKKMTIKSCGIGDWHIGQHPDERMREAATTRGVNLTSRAQQFKLSFFDEFDYIFAADNEVLNDLYRYAKNPEHKSKVQLMTAYSSSYHNHEIPDPYCHGTAAFDYVLDMLEDSCEAFLNHLHKNNIK
jgi:protein-tyrosine phosphatase